MNEEIKSDNNCIIKAFENHPISIINEHIGDKKIYCFKASDIGKALGIVNIHSTIQNYEDIDERVIRKAYDTEKRMQHTSFLTSHGVYRLLYNSKKPEAKKFRKWAGNILDDIIFNDSKELKRQLENTIRK
jgi:anti-repressor protein